MFDINLFFGKSLIYVFGGYLLNLFGFGINIWYNG